jgi:carbonic anhydrase
MREYKRLLLSNKAWAAELTEENETFFSRQVGGQKPDFLWIGCSDSRVSPEQMTMTPPGSMFIHRNIANLVAEDDLNLMSVLQYAVAVLRVKHVIICGHHGCGGIRAAAYGGVDGPIDTWLATARDVRKKHTAEIDAAGDDEARINRFVELNVRDQLVRLAHTDTVQTAFTSGQPLALHGWVYDIRDGLIKPLMEIDAGSALDASALAARVL